mgnify:CR=1 FL=1
MGGNVFVVRGGGGKDIVIKTVYASTKTILTITTHTMRTIHEILPINFTHHIRQLVNKRHQTPLTLHLHVFDLFTILTTCKKIALGNGILLYTTF